MNKIRSLAVLMGIAILGITGFQLYWLRDNYSREEKTLAIKTDKIFNETMMQLQASKLNLGTSPSTFLRVIDSGQKGKMKVIMAGGETVEAISTINVIREKFKDSLPAEGKQGMVISMNKEKKMPISEGVDTNEFNHRVHEPGMERIINLIYGVDSLQEPIKLEEVDTLYKAALQKQKIDIPFSVTKTEMVKPGPDPKKMNEVTVGFLKPVIYRLQLGNTFPYLINRIAAPILFSILLLGITVLSFVLLYRNLVRQQRLAELKNEFISNITHELKTPIATVGVAIEALKNFNAMEDTRRTKEYLDISANELQRLSLLVDKVLKLSMFENKEIELKYETVNIKELVEEVLASLRLQLEKHHASVTTQVDGNQEVRGDRMHLLSVIFNLLDNAVKYSREKPVIAIELKGEDDKVQIRIADNGIGIPQEYREKVFEKFFRVPHGDTHNAKGYGLGLSYAARVIRQHEGTIDLQSVPGNGTTFIITLPKKKA